MEISVGTNFWDFLCKSEQRRKETEFRKWLYNFLVVIFKLAKKCSTTDNLESDGYFEWVGMQGFVVGFF